jgi:hypothetical protein
MLRGVPSGCNNLLHWAGFNILQESPGDLCNGHLVNNPYPGIYLAKYFMVYKMQKIKLLEKIKKTEGG